MPAPLSSPISRSRTGRMILACFAALVMALVLSLAVVYSRQVLTDLGALETAQSDNLQWTLTQVEVEHLSFINALDRHDADGQPDLADIRERYDVLFSRLGTLRHAPLFHDLVATQPEFRSSLADLQDFLQETMPLIDGPDDTLRSALPDLSAAARLTRQAVRALSITGLGYFAVRADIQRGEIATTLRQLAIATASLLFLLMAVSLHLLIVNRQKTRRGVALEQAYHRMNTILSTSLDGVLVTDANGRILEFNGAAEAIFHCRSGDIKGRLVSDLFAPERVKDGHDVAMSRLRKGGERQIVGKGRVKRDARRADGEVFPIELAVQSARDGETEILIAFIRDISGQVADEKELVEARDHALAGEKAKAEFLTVMSHEIRTPLNGILGNLSLLGGTCLTQEQRQFLRNMDVSGRILLKHVDSVLDIAKFEAGKLQLAQERVHLDELMQNLVDGQSGNAGGRGNVITWTWVGAPQHWVVTDAQRIYQILLNLVGNAIKFTKQGRITIEAEADPAPLPDDPDRRIVEFRVTDTGVGIPEDQVLAIFEDFHTSDSSFRRAAGGAGLGLGICRRIAGAMGGEIGVESMPGEGSTFWVRLPFRPTAAPAPREKPPKQRPVRAALAILVVEDNEINLQVTRSMLQREGHRVTCAQDGQSGVEKAGAARFDLIFMDISMPVMDGLEATRRIRAGGGPSADTPIIALSANVLPRDTERFRAAGMDDFLGKPLTLNALRRALYSARSGEDAPPGDDEPEDVTVHDDAPHDHAQSDAPPAPGNAPPNGEDVSAGTLLDPDKMKEMRDNLGQAAFDRLLARFIDEADALIAELAGTTAIAQGTADPASAAPTDPPTDHGDDPDRRAALTGRIHKVAGSASVFGAVAFRQMLNDAEHAAGRGPAGDFTRILSRLAPCWASTRAHLTR